MSAEVTALFIIKKNKCALDRIEVSCPLWSLLNKMFLIHILKRDWKYIPI